MSKLLILLLLTGCTIDYPSLADPYNRYKALASTCKYSLNYACQVHGEEKVYE